MTWSFQYPYPAVYPVQPPDNVYREAYVGERVMNADHAEACYAKILAHAERTKELIRLILDKSDGPFEVMKALKEKVRVQNQTHELFARLDELLNEEESPSPSQTTPPFMPNRPLGPRGSPDDPPPQVQLHAGLFD